MIECREREVHDCCLKSYGVLYFSNMWWDLSPDADCSAVEKEHCSVDAASGGYVMTMVCDGFNRPGCGVILTMLFNIL